MIVDTWVAESYRTRGDGAGFLITSDGETGPFVVVPEGGAPVRVERSALIRSTGTQPRAPIEIVVRPGRDLPISVLLKDPRLPADSVVSAWAWDVASGALIASAVGRADSIVRLENLGPDEVEVVAQVHLDVRTSQIGSWRGRPGPDGGAILLEQAPWWYVPAGDDGRPGVVVSGGADASVRFYVQSVGAAAEAPEALGPGEVVTDLVPGEYTVVRQGAGGSSRSRSIVARHGVHLVVGRAWE